ncbi:MULTISPECIES: hypothetical protein [unclassified Psychrobacter]|nr:hypothetical protein [Psychrobacter sp. P11G5]
MTIPTAKTDFTLDDIAGKFNRRAKAHPKLSAQIGVFEQWLVRKMEG